MTRTRGEAAGGDPQQGLVALGIEGGKGGAVAAVDVPTHRLGKLPAHLGEDRVYGRRGRLLGCRRGGGWRSRLRGVGFRRRDRRLCGCGR